MSMKNILTSFSLIFILSCGSSMIVSERQDSGFFETPKEAKTIVSIPFDLDTHKSILVVSRDSKEFALGMAKNIMYFDRVISWGDFEKEIIRDGKAEEVGSLRDKIGFANAYNKYKPYFYLWYVFNENNKKYGRIKLTNPKTAEDLFVAEIKFDVMIGTTDKNHFNPLFNELIKYIKLNSETYQKINK
jgi:hypothetical protein